MFCDAFFAQLLFFLISRALTDIFPYFPPLPLFPHIAFENLNTSYLQRFLFLPRMKHPTESGIPAPFAPLVAICLLEFGDNALIAARYAARPNAVCWLPSDREED